MPEPSADQSTQRPSPKLHISAALLLWLGMVAATVVPLFLKVQPSGLAVTIVAIAIVVGAICFAFLNAYSELRAEVERTKALLAKSEDALPRESRLR